MQPRKWRRLDTSMHLEEQTNANVGNPLSIQELNPKQLKAIKYKMLEPTLARDLVEHGNGRYQVPSEDRLAHVSEDDEVMVAFINKADVWLYVERYDEKKDVIYAKLCENWKALLDLQQNQRVMVRREHVIAIRHRDDGDDDDDQT